MLVGSSIASDECRIRGATAGYETRKAIKEEMQAVVGSALTNVSFGLATIRTSLDRSWPWNEAGQPPRLGQALFPQKPIRPEPVAAMSIKKRIWIFQLVVVLAVITMAAAALFGVHATDSHLNRVQLSRQQLEATMRLAVDANRYSEQIAELLLIGEAERPDFESARDETIAAISAVWRIAREEIDFAQDPEEKQKEWRQFERVEEMDRLFHEIDLAVKRVLLLDQQGRKAEAISLFRSEIENRLDAEFQKLITTAVADERAEVAAAEVRGETNIRFAGGRFSHPSRIAGRCLDGIRISVHAITERAPQGARRRRARYRARKPRSSHQIYEAR